MTIQDLRRIVLDSDDDNQQVAGNSPEMERLKVLLEQKQFYITNEKVHDISRKNLHNQCCLWDTLGAPQKDGHDMPILPYQRLLLNLLRERKHFWIKKARGIGASTFFLYWCIYMAFKHLQPGDRIAYTVGNRVSLAEDLILRTKRIFRRNFPAIYNELMQQPATSAVINQVKFEAFPSHLASLRGLDRLKIVVMDEVDYYPPAQQKELRATVEGFIGKTNSDPWIILISTPQAPGMIMESIEKEQNSLYYKMFLTYEYGLEGPHPIYDKRQLALARRSPDWPREYEGKYIGVSGNVYSPDSITRATTLGDKYSKYTESENYLRDVPTVLGLDPAWGSTSKYGVVIAQFIDNRIVIAYAAAYSKPDMSEMMSELWRLKNQFGNIHNIMVDSNNPEVIGSIRREFRKDQYSEQGIKDIIANCRKYNTPIENRLFVVPKNFAIENRQMLQHSVSLMDNPEGLVAIPSKFDGLLLAIRTATHSDWKLDKSSGASLNNDLLDSYIMTLSYFRLSNK